MTEVVTAIKNASSEQTLGADQINIAVTQLDQTTQQNAALVEEMAAATASLSQQAVQLLDEISVFRLPSAISDKSVRLGTSN